MTNPMDLYSCPKCQKKLQEQPLDFYCPYCRRNYPIIDGLPDFVLIQPQESTNPFLHELGKPLALIYESKLWFPIVIKLWGGWSAPSLKYLVSYVQERMAPVKGLILDVATGTGTLGRHIAGSERSVYGIDISAEMLQKGRTYAKREGVHNMNFARADGESLPFGSNVFDACLFCGSIHIFPDTVRVLKEVGRTLKPGALVIVTTVIHGEKGILSRRRSRQQKPKHMKIFEIEELQKAVDESGFEQFEPQVFGCLLMFTIRKK